MNVQSQKLLIENFMVGSDPEFCVKKDGQPYSIEGFMGGTKDEPLDIGEGCSRQEDGVAAEFCIPPCSTKEEFIHYMTYIEDTGNQILAEYGMVLGHESSARYPEWQLQSPQTTEFGCMPSWDAYNGKTSPRPTPDQVGNLRSFGCHIHVGFAGVMSNPEAHRFIKCMDICLGVPSLVIDRDTDRRSIYGNAGDYRIKRKEDYTIIEYRSLGAAMHGSKELLEFVYDQTVAAIDLYNSDAVITDEQRDIINNQDYEAAVNWCAINKIAIPQTEEVYV